MKGPRRRAFSLHRRPQGQSVIVFLGDPSDPHFLYLTEQLRQRGQATAQLRSSDFPARGELTVELNGGRGYLWSGGTRIPLAEIDVVYRRERDGPAPPNPALEASVNGFIANETGQALASVWLSAAPRWLPAPPAAEWHAHVKLRQLQLAQEIGLHVPCTIITNSPDEVLAFYEAHPAGAITKTLYSPRVELADGLRIAFTHPIDRRDLPDLMSVRHAPIIVQELVRKRYELRVVVVENVIFAARVQSQLSAPTADDWRREPDCDLAWEPYALSAAVAEKCRRVVHELGLAYCAIDLIVDDDGRYVFLEANPHGDWIFLDAQTVRSVGDALIAFMTRAS